MPIKSYKPTSPGRRDMTGNSFEEITRSKPHNMMDHGLIYGDYYFVEALLRLISKI